MPHSLFPAIHRLRVTADEPAAPDAIPGALRGRGTRRPHADTTCARVRCLIETTTLSYSEISARTGVGRASICRWTRDGGWQRPLFAPRATDTVPSARAGQKLKLRKLAERLRALAERYVRELEAEPRIDPDRLLQALKLIRMARLEAMGRRRQRRGFWVGEPQTGRQALARNEAIKAALKEMRRGGVDLDRIPQEARDLLEDAHTPVEDGPAFHPRGWKRR